MPVSSDAHFFCSFWSDWFTASWQGPLPTSSMFFSPTVDEKRCNVILTVLLFSSTGSLYGSVKLPAMSVQERDRGEHRTMTFSTFSFLDLSKCSQTLRDLFRAQARSESDVDRYHHHSDVLAELLSVLSLATVKSNRAGSVSKHYTCPFSSLCGREVSEDTVRGERG